MRFATSIRNFKALKGHLRNALLLCAGLSVGVLYAKQSPATAPTINSKMVNVVVATQSMSAEAEFYEKTLGFKSFYRDKTSCFLKTGSANLVFVAVRSKAQVTKNLCVDVAVPSLAEAESALKKAGVKVDATDPHVLKLSDPDGNTVEVVHG